MNIIIAFVIGMIVAIVAAIIVAKAMNKKSAAAHEQALAAAKENTKLELAAQHTQALTKAESERDNAIQQIESLNGQIKSLKQEKLDAENAAKAELEKRLAEQHTTDEKKYNEMLNSKEQAHKTALETMNAHHEADLKSQKEQFDITIDSLKSQLSETTEKILKERQEDLDKKNQDSMEKLLTPLKMDMDNVKELMEKNKTTSDTLQGTMENMVKQTIEVGKNADKLADAMKNKGKVHGDWGEYLLENILSESGLRENEEFFRQKSYKGAYGNELRPDVVVCGPDGRKIIVDSKVSITAYTDALGEADTEKRNELIKNHYESVQKHVKELIEKEYPKYVEGSLDYVLMFVQNEGAYVMAMNYHPELIQEAFNKGVIIVNPTNLMLVLHLVLLSWQNTRQEDNCKQIIDAAKGMYEKVISIVDNCITLGNQLNTAMGTYSKLNGQLHEGNGNLLGKADKLKELGVSSTKKVTARSTQKKSAVTAIPKTTQNGN